MRIPAPLQGLSEIKRIHRDHNNLILLFHNDGRNLLDGIMLALPLSAILEIERYVSLPRLAGSHAQSLL